MESEVKQILSFSHMWKSWLKSKRKVSWKTSVINYSTRAIQNIANDREQILTNKWKSQGYKKFVVPDRGKPREVHAVELHERVIQKCFCDYKFIPVLRKRLIYDSGATMKNKGLGFALRRLRCHLQRYGRKYGNQGYVLTFDFKKYFASIDHNILIKMASRYITDDETLKWYSIFVNGYNEGLGLGSQTSQISALFFIHKFDRYIKENLHYKYYGRYMDDCYIIAQDKTELQALREIMFSLASNYKLTPSYKKCKIEKLTHFMYLSRHWSLKENNFVYNKPLYKNIAKLIRKPNKILRLGWLKGKFLDAINKVKQLFASIKGYVLQFKNRRLYDTICNKIRTRFNTRLCYN